jgi:hypothetical protein
MVARVLLAPDLTYFVLTLRKRVMLMSQRSHFTPKFALAATLPDNSNQPAQVASPVEHAAFH